MIRKEVRGLYVVQAGCVLIEYIIGIDLNRLRRGTDLVGPGVGAFWMEQVSHVGLEGVTREGARQGLSRERRNGQRRTPEVRDIIGMKDGANNARPRQALLWGEERSKGGKPEERTNIPKSEGE